MQDVKERVIRTLSKVVAEHTGAPPPPLTGESTFEDLAVGSLGFTAAVCAIEESFAVEISEERLSRIRTVDDMVAAVIELRQA